MLIAIEDETEERINARNALYSAEIEKGRYICPHPECRQPVFPKKGEVKADHFSHYPDCEDVEHDYWEPETQRHMEMKQDAKEYFQKFGEIKEIEIEAYREGLKPDLVLKTEDAEIAVECQHSKISRGKIKRRSQKLGKKVDGVIWILDSENYKASSMKKWDLEYTSEQKIKFGFDIQKPSNYFLRTRKVSRDDNDSTEKAIQVKLENGLQIQEVVSKFSRDRFRRKMATEKPVRETQFLKEIALEV